MALRLPGVDAAPLAGTNIGNQASASYTDANSVARITVSNSVSTIVQQVGSATMTQSQSKIAAPGQTIAFPHTIVNNGNGPDTFTLTLGGTITGSANLAATPLNGTVFYPDANCDGVADNSTPTNSIGPIAPGAQGCYVAQVTAGTTAAASAAIDITFASAFGGTLIGNPNTDTLTISANAVINVSKSISISSGPTGTIVTYQLIYRNTGTVSAGNVVIADTLPAGATYVANSGRWSVATGVTLTDATNDFQGTAPNRIAYTAVGGVGASIAAILERVDPGGQGILEFQATMSGTGPLITNNAQWCYKDIGQVGTTQPTGAFQAACQTLINLAGNFAGATPTANPTVPQITAVTITTNPNTSNTVPFNVPTAGVTGVAKINDGLTGTAVSVDSNPTTTASSSALPGSDNDVAVATAGQGTIATWDTTVWNTTLSSDTYNITVTSATGGAAPNFPAGTTFLLFRSDGFTPLTDSNNDGVLDTGPVAGSGSYVVRVVAILPPSGAAGVYDAIIQAQSTNTTTSTNTVAVRANVIGSRVDLRNYFPAVGGNGQTAAGEVGPVNTVAVNPGTNALFGLAVLNSGGIADSFDLSYNVTSGAYTVASAFTTPLSLPSGFVLKFYRDTGTTCTSLGAEVNNTGVIAAGATVNICAVVTVPTLAPAQNYELYFRALSPTTWTVGNLLTSSADVKRDRLTVNTLRSVAITPNNSGQGFPGGSVQYCHTITNSGNSTESVLLLTQANQSLNGTSGWGQYATFYADTNRNCILDGVESGTPASTSASVVALAAGASTNIIVVVQVPGAAAAGQTNVSSFTLSGSTGITSAVVTDTTTVVLGQIQLIKDQVLDTTGTACTQSFAVPALDGLGTFVQTQLTTGANPGACIIYRVRATNVGTQSVTAVTINDVAPPNTLLNTVPTIVPGNVVSGLVNPCTPTNPAGQNVQCTIATLNGGATTTLYFRVKITP